MRNALYGLNKSHVVAALGLAGAAFTAYCIYFDHKRRSAPDYKEKVRRRRREQARALGGTTSQAPIASSEFHDHSDSLQAFFVREMQLGEELLSNGNILEGTVHMANSVAVCRHPQQLLQIFQQMLSPELYSAVIERLPERLASLPALVAEAMQFSEKSQRSERVPPDPVPSTE
ncbi:Import receptor subunit [Trichostrongylus colubriformis]|uniref:Import receptor subunit n=1 Tax=Trichostrongylus colubriformis TaxID=6319 RepID=A0AAN8F9U0_TRICO